MRRAGGNRSVAARKVGRRSAVLQLSLKHGVRAERHADAFIEDYYWRGCFVHAIRPGAVAADNHWHFLSVAIGCSRSDSGSDTRGDGDAYSGSTGSGSDIYDSYTAIKSACEEVTGTGRESLKSFPDKPKWRNW